MQLNVVELSISVDDEPSNKRSRIGVANKVVVILLLTTKFESKKQWVEPESINVRIGIDWSEFGTRAESDNTKDEETEAADKRKGVFTKEETEGSGIRPVRRASPDELVAASFLSCCRQLSSSTLRRSQGSS